MRTTRLELITLALVLSLVAAGCGRQETIEPREIVRPVRMMTVGEDTMGRYLRYPGSVDATLNADRTAEELRDPVEGMLGAQREDRQPSLGELEADDRLPPGRGAAAAAGRVVVVEDEDVEILDGAVTAAALEIANKYALDQPALSRSYQHILRVHLDREPVPESGQ